MLAIFKTVEKRNEQRGGESPQRGIPGLYIRMEHVADDRRESPNRASHFTEFTIMLGIPTRFKAIIRGIFVAGLSY